MNIRSYMGISLSPTLVNFRKLFSLHSRPHTGVQNSLPTFTAWYMLLAPEREASTSG